MKDSNITLLALAGCKPVQPGSIPAIVNSSGALMLLPIISTRGGLTWAIDHCAADGAWADTTWELVRPIEAREEDEMVRKLLECEAS
jgi:hypothetical protein